MLHTIWYKKIIVPKILPGWSRVYSELKVYMFIISPLEMNPNYLER